MKRVVSPEQVCHLWANKSQSDARTASGNLYFDADSIWSYGSHFLAARHIGDVALITTRTYSVTTAKQLSYIRRAASHLRTFEVDNVAANTKPEHRENLAALRAEYENTVLKASRARSNAQWLLELSEVRLQQANDYSAYFKLTTRIKPVDSSLILARAKEQAAKAKAARAKRDRIAALEDTERAILWRAGEYNGSLYRIPVMCRLTADGEIVQTSHGVKFPAADAVRYMPAAKRCAELGETWTRNGESMPLGQFQIDRIAADGTLTAGCHTVTYDEIMRLDALLNARNAAA